MPASERALFPGTAQLSYALGWVVYDHAGRRTVAHGGAIDGFRAQVAFMPEEGIGIAVLCNLDQTYLNLALTHELLDLLLGRPHPETCAYYQTALLKAAKAKAEEEKIKMASRRLGTHPSHELAAYAGLYEHPAYGEIRLTLRDDRLHWKWRDFEGPLQHFHYDTFLLGVPVVGPARVVFRLDGAGNVSYMRVKGPHLDEEFRRAPGRK
jgi:hypothetical protein